MADARFFRLGPPLSLRALAERTGAELGDNADPERLMRDVASLETAGQHDITFLDNLKYLPIFATTRAGAAFVQPAYAERAPKGLALLLTAAPYRAFALTAQAFYPEPDPERGIHPSAVIDPTAHIGEGAMVAPHAVIEARVEIGRRARIGAGVRRRARAAPRSDDARPRSRARLVGARLPARRPGDDVELRQDHTDLERPQVMESVSCVPSSLCCSPPRWPSPPPRRRRCRRSG